MGVCYHNSRVTGLLLHFSVQAHATLARHLCLFTSCVPVIVSSSTIVHACSLESELVQGRVSTLHCTGLCQIFWSCEHNCDCGFHLETERPKESRALSRPRDSVAHAFVVRVGTDAISAATWTLPVESHCHGLALASDPAAHTVLQSTRQLQGLPLCICTTVCKCDQCAVIDRHAHCMCMHLLAV